ncbi:DNA-binding transcriptional ArsR family regulator [Actinomadura coerulea]|uniref:DNA-binding transcriptional ArsR family regulator n=1 Tax=Actinomadura coerulea TaxID=46159 RepID=A0A7X0FXT4_9ACTN|nr:helix-turn-helix domain-containing protein [Actinomadura coerulea]MBB6395738.1 DNA-binding transcriptional ArsR family regulator [Actinomadura coerulea]GGQ26749.1 transcriptional regulator [Actinomadura coerulea]
MGSEQVVGVDIAPVAALLADRARAAMLTALLDGRPLAAGELARTAGVSAQTASAHLSRLLDGGFVTVVKQGRHRYYRLRGGEVAQVIEALSRIGPPVRVNSLRQSRDARRLHEARTCYDHLAGVAGVTLFAALVDGGLIEPADGDAYEVTEKGEERLEALGLDLEALRRGRRRFAWHCLDWTERRPHLNGALGEALTSRMIELGWFERGSTRRVLVVTETGLAGLADSFGCVLG